MARLEIFPFLMKTWPFELWWPILKQATTEEAKICREEGVSNVIVILSNSERSVHPLPRSCRAFWASIGFESQCFLPVCVLFFCLLGPFSCACAHHRRNPHWHPECCMLNFPAVCQYRLTMGTLINFNMLRIAIAKRWVTGQGGLFLSCPMQKFKSYNVDIHS